MSNNIANSRALGFGVLAIAVWMFSVVHAGIAGPMGFDPHVTHAVGTIAMLGLLIAGIAAFLRRESWLGFFFLLWSGLFWGAAYGMGQSTGMAAGAMRYSGWFLMALALVNFYLWVAAWKSGKLGGAVSFTVLLLWLSFLAFGLRDFFGFWVLIRVGGALGLAAALVAFYVSAGSLCPNMNCPGIAHGEEEA